MYTGLADIIVKEMKQAGFTAKQLGFGVLVSLNREVSTMEVEIVLKPYRFNVRKVSKNQVMIEEK